MSRVKTVAGAFLCLGKSAKAPVLAQIVEIIFPPAQYFVGVSLVSHIPDDLIFWKVKGQIHGHSQLHNPQIGGQMSACGADLLDQKPPDLRCQNVQFLPVKLLNILRPIYPL